MKVPGWFSLICMFAIAKWFTACATLAPPRSRLAERLPVMTREIQGKYSGMSAAIYLSHYRRGYEEAFARGTKPETTMTCYDLGVAQAGYLRGKYDAETDWGAPLDKRARLMWHARHVSNPGLRAVMEGAAGG
jgi:hypothetical protein